MSFASATAGAMGGALVTAQGQGVSLCLARTQSKLDKGLQSLRCALEQPPRNDLERDGVVQRFECCFELLWKTSKRVLHSLGIESASPRSVIRDLARQGLISDAEEWMMLLEARNHTSHTYNEATAQWVFSKCSDFLLRSDELVAKLKAELTL